MQIIPYFGGSVKPHFTSAPLGEAASRRFVPLLGEAASRRFAALLGEAASRRFAALLGEAASRRFIPYCTTTLPANPSNPSATLGAKYNGTFPANGSASGAIVGITTVAHVGL